MEWIIAAEMSPGGDHPVLVFVTYVYDDPYQIQGWFDHGDQCYYSHNGEYLPDVSHWMPLPEPPK